MSDIIFASGPANQLFSPWWFYLLLGLNLILLSALIVFFPALLWLIVSSFMMMDGLLLLWLAIAVYRTKKKPQKYKPGKEQVIIY